VQAARDVYKILHVNTDSTVYRARAVLYAVNRPDVLEFLLTCTPCPLPRGGDPRDTVPESAAIRGKRLPNSSGFAPITIILFEIMSVNMSAIVYVLFVRVRVRLNICDHF
jgi:hypothetical protein